MIKKHLFKVVLLFSSLLILISAFPKGHFLVFDTWRELQNTNIFFFQTESHLPLDWFILYLHGTFSMISGSELFFSFLFGGLFFTFLTAIFFYKSCKLISGSSTWAIFFTTLLILFSDIFASSFYYRSQTISLFLHVVFLFLTLKIFRSINVRPNIILLIIFSFVGVFAHKTSKVLLPLLTVLLIYWFFLKIINKNNFLFFMLSIIFLILLSFNTYLSFFTFYFLGVGNILDPQAFSLEPIDLISFMGGMGLLSLIAFILVLIHLAREFQINGIRGRNGYFFVFGFFMIYFTLSFIFPHLQFFSANIFRMYLFLFMFLLILSAFIFKCNKYTFISLILITSLVISVFSAVDYSESNKITGNYDYYVQMRNIDFQERDVVISSFSATPALKAASSQNPFFHSIFFIGGYNDWGTHREGLHKSVSLFEDPLSISDQKICDLLLNKYLYLEEIPSFPKFLSPSSDTKSLMQRTLKESGRILFFIPLFDQELRSDVTFHDAQINQWWRYRSLANIDFASFTKNEHLILILENEFFQIFEFEKKRDCFNETTT